MDELLAFLSSHGNITTLLIAFAILIVGLIVARVAKSLSIKFMNKVRIERAAISFLSQILYVFLVIIIFISFLNKLGIPTTTLMASIGAIGLAIGLSLQNSFANFAAGIILLVAKPFRADEYIEIQGLEGTVESVHIMSTELIDRENKRIVIPNSTFTGNAITNYSALKVRKLRLVLDVSYDTDHKFAIKVLQDVFAANKSILNAKATEIGVFGFAASSIQIIAYPEVRTSSYWASYYSILDDIKVAFDREGIEIPFTNHTVHIRQEAAK